MKDNTKKTIIIAVIILIALMINLALRINEEKISGKVISTVNITGKQEVNCNIPLNAGWNLISFYCIRGFWNINTHALDSVNDTFVSIFTYDAFDENDKWKSYNPSLPNWVIQDLSALEPKNGYWVFVTADDSWILNGTTTGNTTISITPPWTLVGYPSTSPLDPTTALTSINGNYSEVWMYNSTDSTWYIYYPSAGLSTLNELTPGYGYWIKATNNDSWVITW